MDFWSICMTVDYVDHSIFYACQQYTYKCKTKRNNSQTYLTSINDNKERNTSFCSRFSMFVFS